MTNALIIESKRAQINNLTLHLKELDKEKENKPKPKSQRRRN